VLHQSIQMMVHSLVNLFTTPPITFLCSETRVLPTAKHGWNFSEFHCSICFSSLWAEFWNKWKINLINCFLVYKIIIKITSTEKFVKYRNSNPKNFILKRNLLMENISKIKKSLKIIYFIFDSWIHFYARYLVYSQQLLKQHHLQSEFIIINKFYFYSIYYYLQ